MFGGPTVFAVLDKMDPCVAFGFASSAVALRIHPHGRASRLPSSRKRHPLRVGRQLEVGTPARADARADRGTDDHRRLDTYRFTCEVSDGRAYSLWVVRIQGILSYTAEAKIEPFGVVNLCAHGVENLPFGVVDLSMCGVRKKNAVEPRDMPGVSL